MSKIKALHKAQYKPIAGLVIFKNDDLINDDFYEPIVIVTILQSPGLYPHKPLLH